MHRFLRCSLLAGLMVMASAATAADLLVENVNGYTLDKDGQLQRFDALLIDHGNVVAIGGKAQLLTRADGARHLQHTGEGHLVDQGAADLGRWKTGLCSSPLTALPGRRKT